AFCNGGFALFSNSLEDFRFTPTIHLTIVALLTLGGIGFVVMRDVLHNLRFKRPIQELSVHTKIVLTTHFMLLAFGFIYLFFGEFLHAFHDMSMLEKMQVA